MDWLANIVNGNNLIPFAITVFVLLIVLMFFSKKGYISYNGKGFKLGNDENERRIIRIQLEYTKAELDTYFGQIIKDNKDKENFVEWKCKFSKELVYDIFTEAIALNHITLDEFYIKGKHIKIWAELSKLVLSEPFSDKAFKEECYKETEKIIKSLVSIRKYYSKNP